MNNPNENQHFVSKVLLERFKIAGSPLQCYQVQTGKWIPKNPRNACSSPGYNQLLHSGQTQPDNKLEADFSAVESRLPDVFATLEEAAKKPTTELPAEIYESLCKYCAFLKLTAPYSKPGAVVSFVVHVNMELEQGGNFLSRELLLPKAQIGFLRKEYALGRRVIIESENVLQQFYRFQFQRNLDLDRDLFSKAHWTIFNSPVELPISDVGLVPISFTDQKLTVYLLPIGPNLVLKGLFYSDLTKISRQSTVKGLTLTTDEAEYVFDGICASAVVEVVCSRINPDVSAGIGRAATKQIKFHKIPNPENIMSAGLRSVSDDFRFRIVSVEEYKSFIHSFMQPA